MVVSVPVVWEYDRDDRRAPLHVGLAAGAVRGLGRRRRRRERRPCRHLGAADGTLLHACEEELGRSPTALRQSGPCSRWLLGLNGVGALFDAVEMRRPTSAPTCSRPTSCSPRGGRPMAARRLRRDPDARPRRGVVVDTVRRRSPSAGVEFEVIVVDDGSRDGTAEVLEALDDPRVFRAAQRGQPRRGARAQPWHRAGGAPWIAFLDDDDRWSPDKLRIAARPRPRRRAPTSSTRLAAAVAADGQVLYMSPASRPTSCAAASAAATSSSPAPRTCSARTDLRATARRLRRVAAPHRRLGPVDPPDRGGAAGRLPGAARRLHRARDEHAPDGDRQRDARGPRLLRAKHADEHASRPLRPDRLPRLDR